MTQEEFKKIIKEKGIDFIIEGKNIVINGGGVYLRSLTTLPDNIQFNNGGGVNLKNSKKKIGTSYIKRFGIKVVNVIIRTAVSIGELRHPRRNRIFS